MELNKDEELILNINQPSQIQIRIESSDSKIKQKPIKVGYGYVAPLIGRVTSTDNDVKDDDLYLAFGQLPEKLKTGSLLDEEQSAFCKSHRLCEMVISKDWIPRFIELLQNFQNGVFDEKLKEPLSGTV